MAEPTTSPIEVVRDFLQTEDPGTDIDLATQFGDPDWQRRAARYLDPDVTIEFVVPEEGGLQVMERHEFAGPQGLPEGWEVWMQPWDRFLVGGQQLFDAGGGKVLLLAHARAVMKGSGIEIPQEVAAVYDVKGGRITAIRFHLDQDQARRDAGLD